MSWKNERISASPSNPKLLARSSPKALDRALKWIRPVPYVWDIGAGIRPMNLFKPERHLCVEPHGEYCDVLRDNGFEVVTQTGQDFLQEGLGTHEKSWPDSIILLDGFGKLFLYLAKFIHILLKRLGHRNSGGKCVNTNAKALVPSQESSGILNRRFLE